MGMFPKGKVAFLVTGNINKFNEARLVLAEYGISVAMLKMEAVEIQDDNLEKIAKASVKDAVSKIQLPLFVEDAGLFIKALKGFPGPYSSYVYRTIGNKGVLKLMENVKNRDAYFLSAIAYYSPQEKAPKCFHGRVEGEISKEERGKGGFGFDPIFVPHGGDGRTFGEMSLAEKNKFSHRAEALRKFAEWYRH